MSATESCESIERALALETSGRLGSLTAFRSDGDNVEIVASQSLPSDRRSAQTLLPAIGELLRECQWRANELQLVCTTIGPGSFTGLRIGVTTAKTLAYATGAKLVGVHTLAALAAAVDATPQRIWAILDAQRQELFAAAFPAGWLDEKEFRPETTVLTRDAWLSKLRSEDLVTGPPLDKLSGCLPGGVRIADASLWQPSAESVARVGAIALGRGQTVEPMQLVPHYYRLSAAEEKAQSRG